MDKKLNELLADLVIETHKLQQLHWYVKGPDFFQAHQQLEEFYNQVSALVDEVAEVMLMCDMKPISTVEEFLKASDIKQSKGAFITSKEAFAAVAKDFEHILELVKDIKTKAEEDELDIVAIKCDAYIELFQKAVWMLNQR
ncbi:MAG: DNA starvation/stationary phase protection protein [Eggerthellaceae bacterium]|nr:DNA starvation/stationary phase protection protein [Eggerthellaceae bacterium]